MDRGTAARLLDYIRDNVHRRLAVREVAGVFDRSERWLWGFLRTETGKSFAGFVRELRIQKARRMLSGGAARITEVARACGFSSGSRFSKVFRREIGLSPRTYRDRSRTAAPPDDARGRAETTLPFGGDLLDPRGFSRNWRLLTGTWSMRDRELSGESSDDLLILCRNRLPPNFRFAFSFLHQRDPAHEKSATLLGATDDRGAGDTGYRLLLGSDRNRAHRLVVQGRSVAVTAGAVDLDTWHRILVTHREGRIDVALDGKRIFLHRELLLPPYAARSHLFVGSWDTRLRVRDLDIRALESPTAPRGAALADESAAEGNHEKAVELYEEELRRPLSTARRSETLFKAGMSYLQLGLRMRARSCLLRFREDPAGAYWSTLADLRLLEIGVDELDERSLRSEIERCFAEAGTPETRDLVVDFLQERSRVSERSGDPDRALAFALAAYERTEPGGVRKGQAAARVLNLLSLLRKHRQAAKFGEQVLAAGELDPRATAQLRMELVPVLASAGRGADARKIVALELAARAPNVLRQSRARYLAAILDQAAGRFDAALSAYLEIARDPSATVASRVTAYQNAATLLAVHRDCAAGRRLAQERSPDLAQRSPVAPMRLEWCIRVVEGSFDRILPELDERLFAPREDAREALTDRFLLCVLYELTGLRDRAERGYEVLEKLHGSGPLRRLILPVSYLLGKATEEELWAHPGGNPLWGENADSVLFLLLGLVQERRKEPRRAGALFRFAVAADPLCFWAAALAQKLTARRRGGRGGSAPPRG